MAEPLTPEDRLASLEAEAVLMRQRIRTLADAGELDEVIRLWRRIGELATDLDAARYVVARVVRKQTRQYGFNSALSTAEHRLATALAALGVEVPAELRGVLG